MKDLTAGKPAKLIMSFALPLTIGYIFQLCYSFADYKIVGLALGKDALAAVGATSTLNDLVIGFLIGLTNGFSVISAQKFGAKSMDGLRKAAAHTISLGAAVSLILTVFCTVLLIPILHALNVDAELMDYAISYTRIIMLGMTSAMAYNICASLLRAVGDTVTPLIFLIISTIINVGLDFLLMSVIKLGVAGAAYATVAAQTISAVLCVIYIGIRYPMLHLRRSDFAFDKELARRMMASGLSMGLMQSLVSFGTVALQSSINTFSNNIIIAHTSARKLTSFFMMPFAVLGMTMAAYTAQNFGAERFSRIRTGVFTAVKITWVWCIALFAVIYTVVPKMMYFMASAGTMPPADAQEIVSTGTLYLRVNCILYFVTAVISVFRNSLQGIGEHRTPIVSSALELLGKVAIVVFLTPRIGYWGIIVSEPIVWSIMVIPLIVWLMKHPAMRKDTPDGSVNAVLAEEKE